MSLPARPAADSADAVVVPAPGGSAAISAGRREAVGYTIASSCCDARIPSTTARIIGRPKSWTAV